MRATEPTSARPPRRPRVWWAVAAVLAGWGFAGPVIAPLPVELVGLVMVGAACAGLGAAVATRRARHQPGS